MYSYKSCADLSWSSDSVSSFHGYKDFSAKQISSVSTLFDNECKNNTPPCDGNSSDQVCVHVDENGQCAQLDTHKKKAWRSLKEDITLKRFIKKGSFIKKDKKSVKEHNYDIGRKTLGFRNYLEKKIGSAFAKLHDQETPRPNKDKEKEHAIENKDEVCKKRRKSQEKLEKETKRLKGVKKHKTLMHDVSVSFARRSLMGTKENQQNNTYLNKMKKCPVSTRSRFSIKDKAILSGKETVTMKGVQLNNQLPTRFGNWPFDMDVTVKNRQINDDERETIEKLKKEISVLFNELEQMIQRD